MFWESNPTNIKWLVFRGNTGVTIEKQATDQLYLKSSPVPLFQGLMESDGLEGIEQERLDHLMRYIRESLGNA